jgi:DNA-binding PadR family transcriptional regulator
MVYRTLRYLEKEGFVTSKWDTKGTGPAKRNYALTEKGTGMLHLWAESIEMRKKVLGKFLKQYKQCFKNVRKK